MNLSSILVVTPTQHLESTIDKLNGMPGVEVHVFEEQTGRIIATLEALSVSAEVEGLRRIKSLPDIQYAEMVLHYFEHDNGEAVELSGIPVNTQIVSQTGSTVS